MAVVVALSACEPTLDVGEWRCADGLDADTADKLSSIAQPWSSGFEDRFCDYTELAGFCYGDPSASYKIVSTHAHSGRFAASFSLDTSDPNARQARCVRQGVLPSAAYYGAWYFVPELAKSSALWNLFHFQGGTPDGQHGLWDVSLENATPGTLDLFVYDFLNGRTSRPARPKPIPIGAWFHLEFFLARSADAAGAMALYLDGQLLVEANNLITDDTSWGQWYVGNLAYALSPSDSTVYVDDVSIRVTR